MQITAGVQGKSKTLAFDVPEEWAETFRDMLQDKDNNFQVSGNGHVKISVRFVKCQLDV